MMVFFNLDILSDKPVNISIVHRRVDLATNLGDGKHSACIRDDGRPYHIHASNGGCFDRSIECSADEMLSEDPVEGVSCERKDTVSSDDIILKREGTRPRVSSKSAYMPTLKHRRLPVINNGIAVNPPKNEIGG
jgi:hypothetical protein